MSTVRFENISKSYGDVQVISDFNLNIEDGQFVSFLGPSGCGKTTCLRMVAGLEKSTGGELFIGDDKMNHPFISPEKRNVSMVFQSYAVWPHMNVFENIAYPLKVKKLSKNDISDKVNEVIKLVELDGLSLRMPNQLSGGQQQRVALARGLVSNPRVLLLDEPLSNLDAKLREKMRHDIRELQQKFKMTCIYVTHDQVEAFSMSDKIVIMNKGQIIQEGSSQEIRSNPANSFVQDFIN